MQHYAAFHLSLHCLQKYLFHARIQEFLSGGPRPGGQNTTLTTFFSLFLVLSLIYSLQMGSNSFITEKTILFQRSRGVQLFPAGVGGVHILISIETHIACDFPGGGGGGPEPLSPLWIRTCCLVVSNRNG